MEKTTAVKSTETAKRCRQIVKSLYRRAHEAKEKGQPVAYVMVRCNYNEILTAMDVVTVWTENFAGVCAAKQAAGSFLEKAEAEGYSNVICSYARTGIGFDSLRRELGGAPPGSPDGGMPKPDMLLGSSSMCDPRYKWYQALGKYMDTPIYNFDVVIPPIDADLEAVRDYYIRYQVHEYRGLIAFLEKVTGRKMDYDRLWEAIRIADETYQAWWESYQLRKSIPCPMPTADHFNTFIPGRFLLGQQEALDFYHALYDELKYRVDNKIGVVPDEKYRLIWAGGLPPWHNLGILNQFENLGAVFVIETSYRPWDPVEVPTKVTDPLEHLAWREFLYRTFRYEKARKRSQNPDVELLLEWLEDYQADGLMMHASLSCRATTIGQIFQRNLVQEHVGAPTMFIESDIVDVRTYSEAQTKKQIETFIDAVETYKRSKA